jgi:choice-of-anchor C domain-containing protein
MNMRSVVLSVTLVALLVLGGASASSQIVNGSFETGSQNPAGGWITLSAGSPVIDAWSLDQGSIDYIGGWWPASNGVRSIDLSGLSAGSVSQAIPTIPGSRYAVTFDMSGNPDGFPLLKNLTVTADGGQETVFSYDVVANGTTRSDMKWVQQRYTFVAEDDLTLLAFTSQANTFFGPALDNVNVERLEGICHRNNGKKGSKTLYVDPAAYPAHLAHGDTAGPCEAE